jgi:ABC-type Fe3+ transport system permease subunit
MFSRARCFLSVGTWSGASAVAIVLAGLFGDSDVFSRILLVGILFLLLISGSFLLALGIINLVRDVLKSIHPHPPA